MTKRERIWNKAKEILASAPDGIRYSELVRRLQESIPGEPEGNFTGAVNLLEANFPDEIYKPSRGHFRLIRFRQEEVPNVPEVPTTTSNDLCEESFYRPFAEWLVADLEECTTAIPLGGNRFREKWGTPDVFGVFRGRETDVIRLPIEIVVAEIKTDPAQLITAFGQACAYKLFSHRSYLVIPKNSKPEDIGRLESLCIIFGIGFILFDAANTDTPAFQIRVRAAKHEPDNFYANEYLKKVADDLHL